MVEENESTPAPNKSLTVLTAARSDAEAAMIVAALREAGIYAAGPNANEPVRGGLSGGPGGGDVRVRPEDLDRARDVLDTPAMSEGELVQAEEEDAARRGRPA